MGKLNMVVFGNDCEVRVANGWRTSVEGEKEMKGGKSVELDGVVIVSLKNGRED